MTGVSDDELYRQYETVNLYRRGPGAKVEMNRPDKSERATRARFGQDRAGEDVAVEFRLSVQNLKGP